MIQDEIRTERLVLRPLRGSDAAAIAALLSDWEVARFLAAVPWPYTREDAEAFVADSARPRDDGSRRWAIEHEGEVIGVIGIDTFNAAKNLGYWIGRAHWGKGLMREAAAAVIDAFFRAEGDVVLTSGAFEPNRASRGLQRRLGFVEVGEDMQVSRPHGRPLPHVHTWLGRARWEEAH